MRRRSNFLKKDAASTRSDLHTVIQLDLRHFSYRYLCFRHHYVFFYTLFIPSSGADSHLGRIESNEVLLVEYSNQTNDKP